MNRLRNSFFVFSPAVLLCVIAGVQIYRAKTGALSPWKGGGFGMFSTVDSPAARFVRIYLITDHDEIPLMMPSELSAQAQEVRTIPTRDRLRGIADRISSSQWVPYQLDSAVERYHGLISTNLHNRDAQSIAANRAQQINLGAANILRMARPGENPSPRNPPIEFRRVRAELWMIKFDSQTAQLRAAKFLEVTVEHGDQRAPALPP